MILVDHEIRQFCLNGQIDNPDFDSLTPDDQTAIYFSDEKSITNIGYDLTAASFYQQNHKQEKCELMPGESVFVASHETVHFDNRTVGMIQLKNSRLRMGLSLEAPMYQPGHTTVIYFRLTNLSSDKLLLKSGEKYAALVFEQLNGKPDVPYDGAFQKEFKYSEMADYSSIYEDQIEKLNNKIGDLQSLEKSIYGNVITILTVFIAIFSLINVNITLTAEAVSIPMLLAFNLAIVGAISLFSMFLHTLLFHKKENKVPGGLWSIPAICFILVFILIFI